MVTGIEYIPEGLFAIALQFSALVSNRIAGKKLGKLYMSHSSVYLDSSHKRTGICAESLSAITITPKIWRRRKRLLQLLEHIAAGLFVCTHHIRPVY